MLFLSFRALSPNLYDSTRDRFLVDPTSQRDRASEEVPCTKNWDKVDVIPLDWGPHACAFLKLGSRPTGPHRRPSLYKVCFPGGDLRIARPKQI